MNRTLPHITVCVCTYRRPQMLKKLLEELALQETAECFSFSIAVVDNDAQESARPAVEEFSASSKIETVYCVEPQQSIAMARNRVVANSWGDFVAFFDDDQLPTRQWLLTMLRAFKEHRCDGVLGPVKPHFDVQPPAWVVKGGFYDRPTYPTGLVIDWKKGRTGNVLLLRGIFEGVEQPFSSAFVTGEDQDFFRRMIERGHVFIWCNEAVGYETVPPIRWKRSFMLKRALLRGKISLSHPTTRRAELFKSAIAVPAYAVALPFLLIVGQHLFMKYLIKSFDHAGRLLTFAGVQIAPDQYVTE